MPLTHSDMDHTCYLQTTPYLEISHALTVAIILVLLVSVVRIFSIYLVVSVWFTGAKAKELVGKTPLEIHNYVYRIQ